MFILVEKVFYVLVGLLLAVSNSPICVLVQKNEEEGWEHYSKMVMELEREIHFDDFDFII